MSFSNEVEKKQLSLNTVVKVGDEYYATRQVDSGLTIPSTNLILDDLNVNGTTLDIRTISTPVGGVNFKLKDEEEYITSKIMADANIFIEKEVEVYVGFNTGSFDFADYKNIANVRINAVTKITNGYSIKAKEVTSLISNPTYNVNDKLAIQIIPASTTLDLEDASNFPSQGLIKINNEFIRYNGIDEDTLLNLTRSQVGTSPATHALGSEVFLVTEIIAQNPIDAMLQLLISKDGDGTLGVYDVYPKGLAIPEALIDVARFEEIRDDNFLGEQFTLYMFNQNDTLRFIEAELLRATNSRIFSKDGKISISLLDQVEAGADVPEISEDSIIDTPTWTLGSDKLVNVINIRWDFDDASGVFRRKTTFKDDDSIAVFGEKKPLNLRFKGVKDSLNGGAIVGDRGQRLLLRLSTPRGKIKVRAHFDVSEVSIGDKILLTHRFLPKQGGGLGIADQLEVLSKNIDIKNARVTYNLEYTSFTGIRLAFIGPSPLITQVINQRTFKVPDASCYKVGHALRLYDDSISDYLPDSVNLIENIDSNTNTITMANDFTTALSTSLRIKMATYPFADSNQKGRYTFIGENVGEFSDGSKSYQIVF